MGSKREELKAQIDKLTKEYNAADDDDDLELDIERDGYKAKVRGRHARKVLKKLGLDDDDDQGGEPDPEADPEGEPDPEKDPGKDKEPRTGHRYFK